MRYISVCAGIEAATQGWHHLGWEPVAFSEIEPFPSAVLQHHYPNVPNWGDMTQFKTWPDATIDVLVGGTPCQSFSIAGLRKGLEDPRGNLMLTFLGIADRYKPKWVVWENVPGVLSSNGGRDFGTFLAALGELGYGWAYRVLDAQWFGVAQRRRRVFVVGCLGDQRSAAEVLFESESVSRHPAPSREKGKGVTPDAGAGVEASGLQRTVGTLCADTHPGACSGQDAYTGRLIPAPITQADVAGPLDAHYYKGSGSRQGGEREYVAHPVSHWDGGNCIPILMRQREGKEGGGKGPLISEEKSLTLATSNDQVLAQPVAFRKSRRAQSVDDHETWVEDGITNTLNCHDVGDIRAVDVVAQPVAFQLNGDRDNPGISIGDDVAFTIPANPMSDRGQAVQTAMQVRRLTPVECERLQGFPDNFTRIPWKRKPAEECPDGPRYKALGNSMAVPCMKWIGERIDKLV
jgi:DNA (cytosine-5)-methyltransferase 1